MRKAWFLQLHLKVEMDTSFQEQTVKVAVEFDLPVSELDQLTSQAHQPTSHFTSQRTQPGTGRSEVLESYGGQRGEDVPSRGGNLEGEGQECVFPALSLGERS